MADSESTEEFPRRTLFALVDGAVRRQDYTPGGLCTRFIGISPTSFDSGVFNEVEGGGCETYVIDISHDDLRHHNSLPYRVLAWLLNLNGFFSPLRLDDHLAGLEHFPLWYKIEYEPAKSGRTSSYAYQAFRSGEPTYLALRHITLVAGESLKPVPQAGFVSFLSSTSSRRAILTAFHVGQGMCSLLSNGEDGYLFDAGAGTPVKRANYRRGEFPGGKRFRNDLACECSSLRNLVAVISHPDSDHWRLLEWDAALLKRVQRVFLPAGVPSLATKSPAILNKVVGVGTHVIDFDATTRIEVFRSQPHRASCNSECLVARVLLERKSALFSGDYVYEEMLRDSLPPLANLPLQSYDAVIVPHHGDRASSQSPPPATRKSQSIAFFSAGNHSGYRHPSRASILEHRRAGYLNVGSPSCQDVVGIHLLP